MTSYCRPNLEEFCDESSNDVKSAAQLQVNAPLTLDRVHGPLSWKSITWYSASTGMHFKEPRAIRRRRKNQGQNYTRLFLKGRPGNKCEQIVFLISQRRGAITMLIGALICLCLKIYTGPLVCLCLTNYTGTMTGPLICLCLTKVHWGIYFPMSKE